MSDELHAVFVFGGTMGIGLFLLILVEWIRRNGGYQWLVKHIWKNWNK